ncbi:MAG: putative lipoprotein, partial [Myxococcaceae bacterium]|nr:putative lipoprotein [Myxococcaceae bacterium]
PAMGQASRCLLWNGRLICSRPNDALNGVDLASGATLWSFNLRSARPELKVRTLFVGRMAVQSSDRLATLWEAYPDNSDCRIYYLAILDASGRLVSLQQLSDPAFSLCNHPHAYGFAADAAGQLFIAFAPTVKNPPLISGSPTLVMSYSRDGVFRWKFSDVALKGGELAVGRGLLYLENSATAVLTSTGQPAFTLAQTFGRATATRDRLIPAPRIGATRLEGYEAGSSLLRWTHTLGAGQTFASDQLRLAAWSTHRGVQTVALTFTAHNGKTWLRAISARDGSEAFSCEVASGGRTAPQQLEVADGTLAVMDGAGGCATCEPAHADKSGAFHSFVVPFLAPASGEPWVGTWGGPGHGHQEQP